MKRVIGKVGRAKWCLRVCLLVCWVGNTVAAPSLDPIFNAGPGANNFAEQVLPLANGKVLVCGAFSSYDDQWAPFLCRLDEDGTYDPTFQSTPNNWVRHMEAQPDGKIVIGGAFASVGGVPRNLIARLNPDGTLDPTFDPGSGFQDKLVPPDPNPPYVFWLAIQPDGKILVTGSFATFNGHPARGIARLNSDGSLDTTFQMGTGLDSWGRFVMVQPNNQILLTGWFIDYNGFSCNRMVRLNPDGTPDSAFRPYFGDKTSIYHAALLPDGKMIVSGHTKNEQGLFDRKIARLNPDGTEDPTFLAHSNDRTECVLIQPDGKILVSGWFTSIDDQTRWCLARLNPDGSLDKDFEFDLNFFVWNVALDAKGRILVAGGFWNARGVGDAEGTARRGVARLIESQTPQSEPPADQPPGDPNPDPDPGANPDPTSAAPPEIVTIDGARVIDNAFVLDFLTTTNHTYIVECRDDFASGDWQTVATLQGSGERNSVVDPHPSPNARCYRVRLAQ